MSSLKCNSCGYEGIMRFLSLGEMPPVNAFVHDSEIKNEKKYPLNLAYCPSCHLVQLEEIVPPEELFTNYLHLSAGSATNVSHLKEVSEILIKQFKVNQNTKILEIGSNDGTLLNFFKSATQNVLGVDPAKNLIELNKEKGVEYIPNFFNTSTASKILKERGKFDLIIALNVIPHTHNNIDLLKAARIVLNDNGTLMMEGVYALETILRGEFDTIYHEHVYTFSLHSLIMTFGFAGLTIVDVERIPTQGGSLRVYAMKDEFAHKPSRAVFNMLEEEKKTGFSNVQIYQSVEKKASEFKEELRKLIKNEKQNGSKIIGLGAPARGVVILNYCGLDKENIDYVVDDTPLKQGRNVPGMHIPVKSFETLKSENSPVFLLLSWNYKDNLIERVKKMFSKFKVIVPFPKLEVLEYGKSE